MAADGLDAAAVPSGNVTGMDGCKYTVLRSQVCFGARVFKQLHGFPMGINCGVEMADIYLLSYELG